MTVRLPILFCLLFLLTGIRGQDDFDLGDAFDDPTVEPTPEKKLTTTTTVKPADVKPTPEKKLTTTVKPAAAPKPATSAPKADPKPVDDDVDDGLSLKDAFDGEDTPTKKPQPGQGGGGGGGGSFSNDDLLDAFGGVSPNDPNETDGHQKGGEGDGQGEGQEKQSVIAGVLSALGVAAVGAVSSFIAYQKKKLCFKGQAEDPENVNMDNQKGDQNDPQAQINLLAK